MEDQEKVGLKGSTHLVMPVETRWGSSLDCLESVARNRQTVDRAFAALRSADGFDWNGKDYRYVLDPGWWKMLERILTAYTPLRVMIHEIQAKDCTLAEAVQSVVTRTPVALAELIKICPGDKKRLNDIFDKRMQMFLPGSPLFTKGKTIEKVFKLKY